MRHYPTNSPEALARVVAIAMMADGAIDSSELKSLERHDIIKRLGLDHDRFDQMQRQIDALREQNYRQTQEIAARTRARAAGASCGVFPSPSAVAARSSAAPAASRPPPRPRRRDPSSATSAPCPCRR